MSHNIVRRRGSSYDICAMVVRRHLGWYDYHMTIVQLSYDVVRFTYDLGFDQEIIVVCYGMTIGRLLDDYRSTVVRCRTNYPRFHKTLYRIRRKTKIAI